MKLLFVEYPKCTTCKNAKKYLEENKIDFEDRNIVVDIPTKQELKSWMKLGNLDIKKFFNTSGLIYKSMNLKDKLPFMTEEEKIELLSSNGMLIKRPLLIGKNFVLVGFKKDNWEKIVK